MLARSAILVVSLIVLIGLLFFWWNLSDEQGSPTEQRESVLSTEFSEAAFLNGSSADELLDLARKELAQFRESEPDSPLPWNAWGDFHFRLTEVEDAEQAWKKSLELDRTNEAALFGLANLAFEDGRFEEAASLCESINLQQSPNPRIPLLLADAYLNQNQPQRAVLTLEQHIATESASVQALEMLGGALIKVKEFDEAIRVLQAALQFSPNSTKANYELGQAFLRKKETEQAKIYLDRFKELSKSQSQTTSQESEQFVDRAHAVSVTSQVLADLSSANRQLGNNSASENKMLQALKLQPNRIPWLKELFSIYQSQQKTRETIDVLLRLAELEPQNVDHLLAIGGLYSELEEPEPAVDFFRKAIALAPQDPRCLQAKSIIEQQLND